MKRLIILSAVCAIAMAKPGLYKEKEDFQFSRSSSDEGSKSGFYGAQRGNMGGNYERAHNMDSLAQNQMSGAVRQVEGELGDGAKMRTGSVYTAANSRGTYGSRHFDLSNLNGRNFQEGQTFDDSQLQSSQASAYNQAGYTNSQSHSSRQSGYQAAGHSHTGLNLQADNLQSLDSSQGTGQYDFGRQSGRSHSSGYHSQSGFQEHSAYDLSNANAHTGDYGSNVRLVSATPVRIIVRPGGRVAIPVAAQTYDITHGSSLVDQNSLNSEAEVLSNDNHNYVYQPSNAKHSESSYNYHKAWEKHDTIPATIPVSIPTENPFPKNSELYEDSHARTTNDQYDASRVNSQRAHSSHSYGGYNANVKSSSSQSRLNYDTQNHMATSGSNANAYTLAGYNAGSNQNGVSSDSNLSYIQAQHNAGSRYHGATADSLTQAGHIAGTTADLNSQVENLNGKPKSYQSSYSYHKSWERQGDPYVIKPATGVNYDSQSSQRLTGLTHNQEHASSGSHYQHSHQSDVDCDENGYRRVARSAEHKQQLRQQSQNIEELDQQVEDIGQQAQNTWDQQESLQQSQQNQNFEDLGQQVEDLGQQAQVNWDQQSVQQSQNSWDNLEDLGQQSQKQWDTTDDLGQQTQNTWDKFQGQNIQNNFNQQDFTQDNQDENIKVESLEQQAQNELGQHIQGTNTELKSKLQDVNQNTQDKWIFSNTGHLDNTEQSEQFKHNFELNKTEKPHQMNVWDKFENYETHTTEHELTQQHTNNRQLNWNGLPETAEPERNTGYINFNDGYFDSHSYNHQIQLQKEEKSHREAHEFYGSNNWNIFASSHKQEQNTNADSHSQVNSFQSMPPNAPPLLNLWNKLNNFEQQSTLLTDMGDGYLHKGDNISEVHTSSQNTEERNNTENILRKQNQYSPHGPLLPEGNKDIITELNKSKDTQSAQNDDKERIQDVGRGDIGSEDLPDTDANYKPYRKPFEATVITELAQNKHQDDIIDGKKELNVLSLDEQKSRDQRNNGKNNTFDLNTTNTQYLQLNNRSVGLQEPQNKYLEQKDMKVSVKQETQEHQYFRRHEDSEQTYNQHFGKEQNVFGSPIFQQENTHYKNQHDLQNFQQEIQQNIQNLRQHENHGQQNLQPFGQSENLDQHNRTEIQQHEHGKQLNPQYSGRHENMEQPNLQDFGPLEHLDQQNMANLGSSENLEQQNLQDSGQHKNMEQQNLQDFGWHENMEQQNLQDFGQHENMEQQNLHDFLQHENMEQQDLQDFGQHENIEQQNLQDFGQHENIEQQNLQDFGQHVNMEQQNLQGFGHLDNLGQLNIPDLGQSENVEPQIIQGFGKHENIETQNIQNVDVHEYQKEEQNIQEEQREKLDEVQNIEQLKSATNNIMHPEEINEPIQIQKPTNNLQSIHSQNPDDVVITSTEAVTEKPGFWKSVGNKWNSAKSKISSWFQ